MKKKLFIWLLSFLCLTTAVQAQKALAVMDWKTDVTLYTWLVQELHRHYAFHRGAQGAERYASRADVLRQGARVRKSLAQLMPHLPQRTPLEASVRGRIAQEGFHIEKIIFQSMPAHHVTALMYLPEGKGPFPGVMLFNGHEDAGKATPSYQQVAALLARNGFVVLSVDPVSQSERHQLTNGEGQPLTRGATTEHTLLNAAASLFGHSTAADILWDNVRALDYFVSRAEVDSTRIACMGNSGGAMQAMYFAAYDKRVKAVIPCSYLADREGTLATTGPADGCAHIPGEGIMGMEMADLLLAAAPKPVLVLAGRYDFIPYEGTLAAYRELKKAYTALDAADRLELFTYDDGHGLSRPKREAAASWLRRWFCGDDRPVVEKPYAPMPDTALFVTPTGAVNTAFKEQTLAHRNRKWFDETAVSRRQFMARGSDEILEEISSLTGFFTGRLPVAAEKLGVVSGLEKYILRETGPPLPLLVKRPAGTAISRIVILLHDEGKAKWFDTAAAERDSSALYIAADLRGTGETADRKDANDPKYMNREYRNAMLSLHLGRPLPGQRMADIRTIMNWIETDSTWKQLPVELEAQGSVSWPALHASLFFPRIQRLKLGGLLPGLRYFLENPTAKDMFTWVIPGVLHYYDIPDLLQLAGNRVVID